MIHLDKNAMPLQPGVFAVQAEEFPHLVEVWEASVRATHHFVNEADLLFFKPLVQAGLPHVPELRCIRDGNNHKVGFIGVADGKIEMLFIHPLWRGHGGGRKLIEYAITTLGATTVDVNEQNEQAVHFYLRMGFEVEGRSEVDGTGKPYPLLHLRLSAPS